MDNNIGKYIYNKNQNRAINVDFYEFIDMMESGLTDEEIAMAFQVNKRHIQQLKNEIQKDFQ